MSIFQHLVERRRAHGSDGFRSEQGVGGRRGVDVQFLRHRRVRGPIGGQQTRPPTGGPWGSNGKLF